MYRVRTFNQIAAKGLANFPRDGFDVGPDAAAPHAILLRSHRLADEDIGAELRAVARAGAGTNNVPVDVCTRRGVVVFNTPGANANSVKELVLAALLLSARDVLGGMSYVASLGNVTDEAELHTLVEGEKKRFRGHEVGGRTLGIVGLGAIGSLVARAALDLGMNVLGYDPALSVEAAWRLPSSVRRMNTAHALFARSDCVTLHAPVLPDTRGLIDAAALKEFRHGAVLLNFARQELVDESAVREALDQGRLRAYFGDFPSVTLRGAANVHATPHLGASTTEAEENCAVMAVNQLRDFLLYGNIANSVNFPQVALDAAPGHRIAVTNVNHPGMLGQLTSALADANINVIDMINKSQGEVAYNLIDLDSLPSDTLIAGLEAIEDVMNVRVLDPVQ